MAEQLDTYDFNAPIETTPSKYTWDLWCNGSIWRVREGRDYTCKYDTFRSAVKYQAMIRNMDVRIRTEPGGVVFQFIPQRDSAEFVQHVANAEAQSEI